MEQVDVKTRQSGKGVRGMGGREGSCDTSSSKSVTGLKESFASPRDFSKNCKNDAPFVHFLGGGGP
jgi:hypothetical protein